MKRSVMWVVVLALIATAALSYTPFPRSVGTLVKNSFDIFSPAEPFRDNPYADLENKPEVDIASMGKDFTFTEALVGAVTESQAEWITFAVSPNLKLSKFWVMKKLEGTALDNPNYYVIVDSQNQSFANGKVRNMVSSVHFTGQNVSILIPSGLNLRNEKKFFECALIYGDCTWEKARDF